MVNMTHLKESLDALLDGIRSLIDTKLDKTENAVSATRLKDPFTLTLDGDVQGTAGLQGGSDVTLTVQLPTSAVAPGSYTKLILDEKGRVVSAELLAVADIPELPISKVDGLRAELNGLLPKNATALSAYTLTTTATINGVNYNGSADVEIRRIKGLQEYHVGLANGVIDLSQGNLFTRIIDAPISFTLAGVAPQGLVSSFTLELMNGGSHAIGWWHSIRWPRGEIPELSLTGTDVLGFYSYDGGNTWTGMVLAKDVR